jgi:3'(2'), 5'-bisphosphate nucleotidase
MINHSLITDVARIAREAGAAILSIYETDFTVTSKEDASPVTAADRAAHAHICDQLSRLTPDIPVLSEESPPDVHDYERRRHWSRLWLVDPLDGTREFVKRNGEFTVNIALIDAHRPVLGVVYAPVMRRAWFGAAGIGAWQQRDDESQTDLRARTTARDQPVVVGSRSHRDTALDALLARLGPHELKSIGSSLKFCLVAEGTADFYPRFGPTSEWDTAAGQAVLESAGGRVTDFAGQAVRYNAKPSLLNPGFIAFADSTREWRRFL